MTQKPSSVTELLRTALMAACIGLSPLVSAASNPFLGFDGPVYPNPVIPLGNEPYGMLEGDFNEDGLEDLAVFGSFGIVILIGNGDCTFSRTYLPVFDGGGSGAIGDFNEDNHQDLAVADTGTGVKVLLGNGDGTFGPTTSLTVPGGSFSWAVAVADFNEDNHQDLLLGFYNGTPFGFFAGNGDGTFAAATTFSLSGGAWDIGVADFDENLDLDLIAGTNTPKVRLGSGNGTFAEAGSFPVGDDPEGLLVFDFNGDGHADFATANSASDDISVRLGNGDGTFAAETRYPVGFWPRFLAVADVDADGNEDLFVGYAGGTDVSLLAGNGDGTFVAEVRIPLVHAGGPNVIVDFDADGRLDLAMASTHWEEVIIRRGHGDGTFEGPDPALVQSISTAGGVASAFGDVDKDGLQDVVVLGVLGIAVLVADGTGAFPISATDAAGTEPSDVAIADINNDSNPDVIATNFGSNDASILLGNGDGTFGTVFSIPLIPDPVSVATGLFNTDVNIDLAVLSTFQTPRVLVFVGNGDATFSLSGVFPVGPGAAVVETGDFDEDGETDLVVLNVGSSDLSVLIGVGDGSFEPEVRYGLTAMTRETVLTVADVDADGHQDLVVPYPDKLVLYGAGDGTFGAATPVGSDDYTEIMAFGDVNGDGRTDLVGAAWQVRLQLGQEDGSFGEPAYFASVGYHGMILEDTNGDGRNDVIIATGGGVAALLNVEPSVFNFLNDKITLRWPDVDGALSYNVYRGLLSDLVDGDDDGLPDLGYGDCQNALDPDTTDLLYVDASVPAPDSGYFYVIAVEDWAGERLLGTTSDGFPRVPTIPCP